MLSIIFTKETHLIILDAWGYALPYETQPTQAMMTEEQKEFKDYANF